MNKKIPLSFLRLLVIYLVLIQNLQSNEIKSSIINKDTYRFQTTLDTKDVVIEYFDRQMPDQNISKWFTWYENDFFDTSDFTNYALKILYCSNPDVYNLVQKKKKILIINRSLIGELEMILIDNCDLEKEVNKLK